MLLRAEEAERGRLPNIAGSAVLVICQFDLNSVGKGPCLWGSDAVWNGRVFQRDSSEAAVPGDDNAAHCVSCYAKWWLPKSSVSSFCVPLAHGETPCYCNRCPSPTCLTRVVIVSARNIAANIRGY